jgi:undecaprenyl-diphosphatase
MAAIILYFRFDLVRMLKSFFDSMKSGKFSGDPDSRLFLQILAGTLPIVLLGYVFKGYIRSEFRNMYVIASAIIFFTGIIFISEKYSKQNVAMAKLKMKDALFIGLFQSMALIPGASRSGITIAGSFFRNMPREDAARFSFLLSIPAVFLSGVYEFYSEREVLFSYAGSTVSLLTATVVSGIVGYISIWFMLSYLKTHTMKLFIIYRLAFALLILILLYFNVISN